MQNETEEAIKTNAKSYYDKSVQNNARFQSKSGLRPTIIRTTSGKTCKWCQSLAGTYEYDRVDKDVFRRHANCDCLVVYSPKKGSYQNVYSKEWMNSAEYKEEKKKRIEFLSGDNIKTNYKDVTKSYYNNATPKKGSIDYDQRYDMSKRTENERRNMDLIHNVFGGDIYAIEHTNYDYSTADYIWNEAYWELKNPESLSGIDQLVRKGIKQIAKDPGGLIIDIGDYHFSIDDVIERIEGRIFRKENEDLSIDIILVKKNKIVKVIRY